MAAEKNIFNIPTLHYFRERNKYSGSTHKIFRYKIFPSDVLECIVWHGVNASDCITEEEIKGRESFPLTEEGRTEMLKWLEEQYMDFALEHTELPEV